MYLLGETAKRQRSVIRRHRSSMNGQRPRRSVTARQFWMSLLRALSAWGA